MNELAPDAHPAEPDLAAYARGELAEPADKQIEEHLEQCQACCLTLSQLSSDTLVSLLRQPLPQTPQTEGPLSSGDQPTLFHPSQAPTKTPREGATLLPGVGGQGPELPPELANHSRYEILRLLGQGGMGNVYQAQHRLMNRLVALKVINQQLVRSDTAVRRFQREVQAAAQLSHPNIVAAYDAEQAGNLHFLVMEYVDGIDLAEVVRRRGPLPAVEACEYIRQAALGLQHAHELGMVHRDIKPQNLILSRSRLPGGNGDAATNEPASFNQRAGDTSSPARQAEPTFDGAIVKILDFGLAQLAAEPIDESAADGGAPEGVEQGHLTLTGAMMGTPDYISPEQAKDAHSADIRADIYSLGCTLYCLLTGGPPFASGTPLERALAHSQQMPKPLSEHRSDLPAGLEDVLGRMMAKQAADRFQTPAEVAAALAPYASRVGFAQPMADKSPQAKVHRSRTRLAVAASVVLALFAVLAGVIVVVTDKGRIEVRSEVDDVKVVVSRGGQEIETIDLATDSRVKWFPSGDYEISLRQGRNDIRILNDGFRLSRWGKQIVSLTLMPAATTASTFKHPPGSAAFVLLSDEYEWTQPENLGPNVNSKEVDHYPFVSADDLTLLFGSNRPGGVGDYDIWLCTRSSTSEPWSKAVNLGAPFNTVGYDAGAVMSADGRTMIYPTTRAGGLGGIDLWMSTRKSAGEAWNKPVHLENDANSLANEMLAYISPDSLRVIFGSNRSGLFVPWIAERGSVTDPWSKARPYSEGGPRTGRFQLLDSGSALLNLPSTARGNVSHWNAQTMRWDLSGTVSTFNDGSNGDWGYYSEATSTLYFESDRPGGQGNTDLWMSRRVKKQPRSAGIAESDRLQGHKNDVQGIAYSPDGKYLFSVGGEKLLYQWDIAAKKVIRKIPVGNSGCGLAALPDSRHVVTSQFDGSIKLWDMASGREARKFTGHKKVAEAICVSPDGKYLLSGGHDGLVRLWNIATGEPIHSFQENYCDCVAISRDGQFAAHGTSGKGWRIWELESGRPLPRKERPSSCLFSLTFSPDGKYIVSGDGSGVIQVWDIALDTELFRFDSHRDHVTSLVFAQDGKHFLSGSWDGTLRMFDLSRGLEVGHVESKTMCASNLAISADGRKLATAGGMRIESVDNQIKFHRDGDYDIHLWQLPKSVRPRKMDTDVRHFDGFPNQRFVQDIAVVPSPDGSSIVTVDSETFVRFWNVDTGKESRESLSPNQSLSRVAVSPDGKTIAAGSRHVGSGKGYVGVWDVASGKRRELDVADGLVFGLAFSHDGARLLVGTHFDEKKRGGTLAVYDPVTGDRIRELEGIDSLLRSIAPFPNSSRVLVGGHSGLAGVWDYETGKLLVRFEDLPPNHVHSVAVSPDGTLAALGFSLDHAQDGRLDDPNAPGVWLYDVNTGQVVRKLRGHTANVNDMAWSADGRLLVTGSAGGFVTGIGILPARDNTLRVWNAATGEQLASIDLGTGVRSLILLPDGQRVVIATGDDGTGGPQDLRLWRLPESVRPKSPHPRGSAAFALLSDEYEWTEAENLGPNVNSDQNEVYPWVSADGLTLMFGSSRKEGEGDYDIWQCNRSSVDEPWSKPVNLKAPINTTGFDSAAQMSADARTLVFVSVRSNGLGLMDLWTAKRESASDDWGEPVNLGDGVNSPTGDTLPFLSPDGRRLMFSSLRTGAFLPWIAERGGVADPWSKARLNTAAGNRGGRPQLLDFGSALLHSPHNARSNISHWNIDKNQWEYSGPLAPCVDGGNGEKAFYSEATDTLYFESDRPGGQGKIDLWISKRVKKKQASPIASLTDYERLQGAWVCTDGVLGNKPLTREAAANTTMKFDHDQAEVAGFGSKTFKLKFALRQFGQPKWIEFINPDKTADELSIAGIYELDGDTLRIAFDDADRPRPRDFKPTDAHDHFVGTFRKAALNEEKSGGSQVGPKPAKPTVPATRPAITIGQNLVIDPSLENTKGGEKYPAGWGTGNMVPPNTYRHQVAEGGRTGKQGWLIEGDGQFAVIPTNRPPAHADFRFAARGWVKIESGSAQIKLLYFDGSGRYIGENRSAACFVQDGWQRLTMIDDQAKFPEARFLSLAPTLIGKGKAVFDDLELVAFEAARLPKNFETEYGGVATNQAALFDRWVGRWETTTEYKPTAATAEKTIKGEVLVRKILDDKFLWWEWKGEGNEGTFFSLLAFDEYASGYHIWLFGDRGESFERIGAWDAASQTLTLQLKPPAPGLTGTSTERFVGNDRIESSLLVKGADGQVTRDMRMTWIRKEATAAGDVGLAEGPAKSQPELALLEKMAGNWSIRSIDKPSVWSPKGKVETFTEKTQWVLGGRFLLFRGYDDKQQMKSLALMTYDPKEKSYHYRHFAADVFGGQWRITWDESSRAFHWRSVDMPAGWIGTGFNRWVNDDTFDNQALIKDEEGKVLLDGRQEKKRIK